MSIDRLARTAQRAADLLLIAAAIGLLIMTAVIGWQVFGRFILGSSPSWSEQGALTLMIWFVFLGSAAGVRDRFHIRILALQNMMPARVQHWMRLFANIFVGFCGLSMLIWGGDLVIRTWSHTIPSLGISRGLAYLAIPISGALITLFSLERALLVFTGKAPDRDTLYNEKAGIEEIN